MPVVSRSQAGRLPRLLYVRSFEDSNIWRVDAAEPGHAARSAPVMAISSTRRDFNPRLSPDGRRVAFDSNRSGNVEIWIADPGGTGAIQLTSMGASSGFANWSPDGRWIAFHSNADGQWRSYLIPSAGGKPLPFPGNGWPSFSHDSQWIYFNASGQIWKARTSGADAVQLSPNGAVAALESVDGKHVYYRASPSGPGPLWRMPASGGRPVKLLDGVFDFFLIEQGLYYIDQQADENRLQFLDFHTGKSTLVARRLGRVRRGLTASQDGRTIFFARVDSSADDLMLVEGFK